MIRFEEAISILTAEIRVLPSERVKLEESIGRVLAEDIYSDMDMPPFNKSAVDGFACRKEDLGRELRVIEVISAGKVPEKRIESGECSKLMTGGMLPDGAEMVIMLEDVEKISETSVRFTGSSAASNICLKAEDITIGMKVLSKGRKIRPQDVAILASVGAAEPLVTVMPRIGIITTGDELVEPSMKPGPSQIRNSNAWQLIAQSKNSGCLPTYYGIAIDNEAETLALIEKAASENHIVVLTGGISVGDFDFVPKVISDAGFTIRFRKLAVQPGKPSIFATRGSVWLFALPGNPVSSFVQFELMVKRLIHGITGMVGTEQKIKMPLGFDYKRRRTDRKAFIPVRIMQDGTLGPVEYHGSAHIHSYLHADGIISIEIGEDQLMKGSLTDVRLL